MFSRGIRMTASMIVGSRKGNHMESSSNGPRFPIGISWWIARILPHYRSSDLQKPRAQPGLRDRWWIAPSCRADHSRCAAVMAYAGWGLYIMTLGLALGLGEMLNRENLRAMFHWYWCVFGMKVVWRMVKFLSRKMGKETHSGIILLDFMFTCGKHSGYLYIYIFSI